MKKIIMIILALALMVFAFAGCAQTEEVTEVTATTEPPVTFTVAVDDTYPPMEYINEDGELVGFDIDFAKALAEEMGMEIEFKSTAWDAIFMSLSADQYDSIISSVSVTQDRKANMEFSTPYLSNGQVIVVNIGSEDTIKTPADLEGLTVGVQFATTADEAATKQQEKTDFEILAFNDMTMCLAAMEAGSIDAIVADMSVAIDFVGKNPDKFVVSSAQLTNEPIAVAINKGNTELLEKVNAAIKVLQDNGTLAKISNEHLGDDYTTDIDTELR